MAWHDGRNHTPFMASLWKHPQSKYWVACYTDATLKQRKTSTKIEALEKNRKKAMQIAEGLEDAHKRRMTASQIMHLTSKLMQELTGEELASATVRGFLNGYLKRRKREVKPGTYTAYKGVVDVFLTWLGEGADGDLFRVEKRHVQQFRDHMATTVSTESANKYLKFLRVFFGDAKRDRLILDNPCEDVPTLKRAADAKKRRGFTEDEIRVVLREVKGTDWASMIRFGLYTGQRLGDLAALRWGAVDLVNDEVRFTTAKTGRVVIVPLCEPLKDHILTLPGNDDPAGFVHPRAAAMPSSYLSKEFGDILERCGFRAAVSYAKKKKADGEAERTAGRNMNELSFHSLRHSAVSMMKNAGMSAAVVQDLVGHESAEMSAHYTHIDSAAKRKALDSLPSV